MCMVLAFTSWLQNGCCVANLYLCIPEVRVGSMVLKRPSSFLFYNPESNSFSEEDHCAFPLNNVTCSALILKENLSLLLLDFADMRDHEGMFSSIESSGDPWLFFSNRDFCCFFWSWVWWMTWDLLWSLWKLKKKNGSREYFIFHIQINKLILNWSMESLLMK